MNKMLYTVIETFNNVPTTLYGTYTNYELAEDAINRRVSYLKTNVLNGIDCKETKHGVGILPSRTLKGNGDTYKWSIFPTPENKDWEIDLLY